MIKQILKVFGMHLMCAIGALFILLLFPGVVSFRFGEILYSVFAFIIFFDVFYTLGKLKTTTWMRATCPKNYHINQ